MHVCNYSMSSRCQQCTNSQVGALSAQVLYAAMIVSVTDGDHHGPLGADLTGPVSNLPLAVLVSTCSLTDRAYDEVIQMLVLLHSVVFSIKLSPRG